MRPEDIDFPVSYDWACFYNQEHKLGFDLPVIDDRLPWQRDEAAKLDAAIERAAHESGVDIDNKPLSDDDINMIFRRLEYLELRLRDIYDSLKRKGKSKVAHGARGFEV